jgi:hypothetical protein
MPQGELVRQPGMVAEGGGHVELAVIEGVVRTGAKRAVIVPAIVDRAVRIRMQRGCNRGIRNVGAAAVAQRERA